MGDPVPENQDDAAQRPELETAIRTIWQRSRPKILERVQTLESAADALVRGPLLPELRSAAQREAHRLAGTLGTFGLRNAGERARAIELRLASSEGFDDQDVVRFCDDVVALRDALDEGPSAAIHTDKGAGPIHRETKSVWFVSRDPRLTDRHREVFEASDHTVRSFGTALETRDMLEDEAPTAAVVDLEADEPGPLLDLIHALAEATGHGTIVVLGDPDHLHTRVEVARAGADRLLGREASPDELIDAIKSADARSQHGRTILAVDDDPSMLEIVRAALEPDGHQVVVVDDAALFWDALLETDPDLVLLDNDMPSFSGLDLCRALRTDSRYETVPVLFLTTDQAPGALRSLFSAGADDFVPKPVEGPELRARVANRFRRVGAQGRGARRDRATGSATDVSLIEDLGRTISVAGHEKTTVGFALFDTVPGLDRRTHDDWQRRLARAAKKVVRAEDVHGVDQGHVVVAWYGTDRGAATTRARDVIAQLAADKPEHGSAHGETAAAAVEDDVLAVVGEWPTDGTDWSTLRSTMVATLVSRRASPSGPSVVPCGWHPETHRPQRYVDVLLVDDDETFAALLLHSLESVGMKAEWMSDGKAAEASLVGPSADLRPRVVLLDVNLPGLDGLSLLRRLHQAGLLNALRVIMVTARSSEAEVVAALQAGAVDHISKPLSIPVLLQRLRRAMEE